MISWKSHPNSSVRMFDFLLQSNTANDFFEISEPPILAGKEYHRNDFKYPFCRLTCFSHEAKESYYVENDSTAVFVYGKVFRQYKKGKAVHNTPLGPEEIMNDLAHGENLLSLYKGNFSIIIISKQAQKIQVINDHFAFKPVYYQANDSHFTASSNLGFHKTALEQINYTVVLERLLFTYPISDDTYLKNVKFLNGGEELVYEQSSIKIKINFDLKDFIFRDQVKKFDLGYMVEVFNHAVSQRANCSGHTTASLTGGLDGRAVVSVLVKEKRSIETYSFGCKGGENTTIPLKISEALPEVNYTPFWLDQEFEDAYVKFGLEAIYLSDGLSFFERANYPYAFDMLSGKSRFVISGLLGGELLGPVNMVADYINRFYYELFFEDKSISWKEELGKKPYVVNQEIMESCREELDMKISLKKQEIAGLKARQNGFLYYYYDLLDLGYRRFYGSEIHIERYYAENLTPFLDFDVLDYLFSTDYIEIFKNAYNPNPFSRRNSKIIQSKVICENSPVLGSIKVDRNFKPRELLNAFSRIRIPVMFYLRKYITGRKEPEFDQEKWNGIFYSTIVPKENKIIDRIIPTPCIDLNIAVSLILWLEKISGKELSIENSSDH
jgi:hypothetical protein